jgi:hypothetical protein
MHVLRDDPRNFSVLRSEPSATSVSRDPEPSAAQNFRHAAERRQQIAQRLKRKLQTIERAQDLPKRRRRNPRRVPTPTSAHCVGCKINERTCSCVNAAGCGRSSRLRPSCRRRREYPHRSKAFPGSRGRKKSKQHPCASEKHRATVLRQAKQPSTTRATRKTSVAAALRGINWRRS